MRPGALRLASLVAASAFALGAIAFAGPAKKSIHWQTDLSKAKSTAAKQKRIMMVDFYADWWGWCKKLDADVYPSPKVVDLAAKMIDVKINADKDANTARKYGVEGLPTIIFLNSKGAEIHKIGGYLPAKEFAAEMQTALSKAKS